MCFNDIKFNNEARTYYLAENRENYSYICGPYINIPCIYCIFHFEFLFLRDNRNRDCAQYMDIRCYDV